MGDLFYAHIALPIEGTSAKGIIKNDFTFETIPSLYENTDESGIPIIYKLLHQYYAGIKDKKIITLSMDSAVTGATVSGVNERYMRREADGDDIVFKSDLKILYIDSKPDLLDLPDGDVSMLDCMRSVVSNLMNLNNKTYTKHRVVVQPEQLIYFGLNENLLTELDDNILSELLIEHYTLQTIRRKGFEKILDHVKSSLTGFPVHVILDISALNKNIAPCTVSNIHNLANIQDLIDVEKLKLFMEQYNKSIDGFDMDELNMIINKLKDLNVVALDITGYDFRMENTAIAKRITCETIRRTFVKLFDVKERSINIFNENSRFLIWRPLVEDTDEINDTIKNDEELDEIVKELSQEDKEKLMSSVNIGWYILRGIPSDLKEQLLATIGDDDIKTFTLDIDGEVEDVMVAVTTMNEQMDRSCYTSTSVYDKILYPGEKVDMMFELVNTNNE